MRPIKLILSFPWILLLSTTLIAKENGLPQLPTVSQQFDPGIHQSIKEYGQAYCSLMDKEFQYFTQAYLQNDKECLEAGREILLSLQLCTDGNFVGYTEIEDANIKLLADFAAIGNALTGPSCQPKDTHVRSGKPKSAQERLLTLVKDYYLEKVWPTAIQLYSNILKPEQLRIQMSDLSIYIVDRNNWVREEYLRRQWVKSVIEQKLAKQQP